MLILLFFSPLRIRVEGALIYLVLTTEEHNPAATTVQLDS